MLIVEFALIKMSLIYIFSFVSFDPAFAKAMAGRQAQDEREEVF